MRLFEGTVFDRPPRCDRCGELESQCACPLTAAPRNLIPPEKQTARISIEKRKKGKQVTVIRGLSAEGNDLPGLFSQLKASCGAGGALHADFLEIQGNHVQRIGEALRQKGYRVKA